MHLKIYFYIYFWVCVSVCAFFSLSTWLNLDYISRTNEKNFTFIEIIFFSDIRQLYFFLYLKKEAFMFLKNSSFENFLFP